MSRAKPKNNPREQFKAERKRFEIREERRLDDLDLVEKTEKEILNGLQHTL